MARQVEKTADERRYEGQIKLILWIVVAALLLGIVLTTRLATPSEPEYLSSSMPEITTGTSQPTSDPIALGEGNGGYAVNSPEAYRARNSPEWRARGALEEREFHERNARDCASGALDTNGMPLCDVPDY